MRAKWLVCASSIAMAACGTSSTSSDQRPVDVPAADERAATNPGGQPAPEAEPEESAEAEAEAEAEPAEPSAPLPHASSITGYVRVMSVPELSRGAASVIDAFTTSPEPRAQGMSRWELTFRPGGQARILVPHTLPAPFQNGMQVTVDARWQGGGPNGRGALVITDDRGLVFAAQQPPVDWTVEPGQRARTDRSGGDAEHRSQVVFTRSGQRVTTVEPDAWTSAPLDGARYYFWGTAVERVRGNPNTPPPPDYVGSWLDFAIARAP